jgi:enterochelin esterase-like enzyme
MQCRVVHAAPAELGISGETPEFHALAMPRNVRGEIYDLSISSRRLSGDRFVRVYVPAAALAEGAPLPVILVNDGHKAFEPARAAAIGSAPWEQRGTLQLHRIMDGLTCGGEIRPAMVVAVSVHAASRGNEFVPCRTRLDSTEFGGQGEEYLDLLEHDILPALSTARPGVRVSTDPTERLLLGTSLGGFAALYGALTRPAVFGGAIALSPSAWVDDGLLSRVVGERGGIPGTVAVDIGASEAPHNRGYCDTLFGALRGAAVVGGGRVSAQIVPGHHNEDSWRGRLPDLLRFVLGR